MLYAEAFKKYFGMPKDLVRKPFPFKCIGCGFGIYAINEAYPYIRHVHKERLAGVRTEKKNAK